MAKINEPGSHDLVEAVLLWTGWGEHFMPRRDETFLVRRFGMESASRLMAEINALRDDFYSSNARTVAADLPEMEKLASDDFRRSHPDIPEEIVKAFAWCYTFDFR